MVPRLATSCRQLPFAQGSPLLTGTSTRRAPSMSYGPSVPKHWSISKRLRSKIHGRKNLCIRSCFLTKLGPRARKLLLSSSFHLSRKAPRYSISALLSTRVSRSMVVRVCKRRLVQCVRHAIVSLMAKLFCPRNTTIVTGYLSLEAHRVQVHLRFLGHLDLFSQGVDTSLQHRLSSPPKWHPSRLPRPTLHLHLVLRFPDQAYHL